MLEMEPDVKGSRTGKKYQKEDFDEEDDNE